MRGENIFHDSFIHLLPTEVMYHLSHAMITPLVKHPECAAALHSLEEQQQQQKVYDIPKFEMIV
jgi:hypothetical protein